MERKLTLEQEQEIMYLHQNIKLLRKQMKLSQEELARAIGLNRGNIASYENGTAEPKICNLLKFSRLFGVSVLKLTHSDLSHDKKLDQINHFPDEVDQAKEKLLQRFSDQAEKTGELIRSVRTCYRYRQEHLQDPIPEMQAFLVHFEELYQVADQLLCDHKALIQLARGQKGGEE